MLAYLDHQCDLTVFLEGKEPSQWKECIVTGQLVRGSFPRYQIGVITLGVDDAFARDHGNWRTGARFTDERRSLDVRLSLAAYADFEDRQIFSERYDLRDGSKILLVEATHGDHSLGYTILKENLAFIEEHRAEIETFLAREK